MLVELKGLSPKTEELMKIFSNLSDNGKDLMLIAVEAVELIDKLKKFSNFEHALILKMFIEELFLKNQKKNESMREGQDA